MVAASDADLRDRLARWPSLPIDERRSVLTELHRRGIVVSVTSQSGQRFGYRVLQPDGSLVEVMQQVRVVQVGEIVPQHGFGAGYEQRAVTGPPRQGTSVVVPVVVDKPGWQR